MILPGVALFMHTIPALVCGGSDEAFFIDEHMRVRVACV